MALEDTLKSNIWNNPNTTWTNTSGTSGTGLTSYLNNLDWTNSLSNYGLGNYKLANTGLNTNTFNFDSNAWANALNTKLNTNLSNSLGNLDFSGLSNTYGNSVSSVGNGLVTNNGQLTSLGKVEAGLGGAGLALQGIQTVAGLVNLGFQIDNYKKQQELANKALNYSIGLANRNLSNQAKTVNAQVDSLSNLYGIYAGRDNYSTAKTKYQNEYRVDGSAISA